MNLELLIKLAKLANNNPNENEANLAARKVCKMIGESNYKFTSGNPIVGKMKVKPDTNKEKEPRVYQPGPAQSDWIRDIFTGKRDEQYKGSEHGYKYAEHYNSPIFTEEAYDFYKGRSPFSKQWQKPPDRPERRMRTCVECGKEELTRRITNVFKCDVCEWKSYQDKMKDAQQK